ncbi:ttl domain containing protein [Stylonychia lemnae]|uniref:Ttl domain containing protein n=1 Tax=Stylonychia lemnae TaxID=5949 RepID=A0A078BAI3_STYLE|nr:ttl domain containing protein [Stylonychia lemnae]|eukprot:CDW90267.1 ttl domain containing protein [Stylonychia lemnae]
MEMRDYKESKTHRKSPKNSQRNNYLEQIPKQQLETDKDQALIKKYKQIQILNESINDSTLIQQDDILIPDQSNLFINSKQHLSNQGIINRQKTYNPSDIKGLKKKNGRPLKPLPKHLYIIKRYDATQILSQLNENSSYNLDYQPGDLKLIGNQFSSKPSPMPTQAYQNISPNGPRFNNKFNSSKQINDHKELLHFLKQKYQQQHDFIMKQEYQLMENKTTIKQKHFDIRNFDNYQQNQQIPMDQNIQRNQKNQSLDISIKSDLSNQERDTVMALEQNNLTQLKQSEANRHRKILSSVNARQKNSNTLTPLKKSERSRLLQQNLQSIKTEQINSDVKGSTADQLDRVNKMRKSTAMNQRLKPKKSQNTHSTHLLLQQKKIEDNEKIEKIFKLQKQIRAKYNDISVTQRQISKDEPYKYIVIRGNNSELVKKCLDQRGSDWQEISSNNTIFHFKWVPFSKGIRFDYLSSHGYKKMVNHFEYQEQISQKDWLMINLSKYCEQQRLNVFDFIPVTFIVNLNHQSSSFEMEKFNTMFTVLERANSLKYTNTNKYTIAKTMYQGHNFWLIKPPDFNRGRGVQVFNNLDQLKRTIQDYQQGVEINLGQDKTQKSVECQQIENKFAPVPQEQLLKNFTNLENVPNIVKTNQFVIQKYLEKPLLINRRKFDIRLWVLIAQDHKCYLFSEGYIRTSSFEFELTPQSIEKPHIHLTNNAVQKYNEYYGNFEEGNQLSFKQAAEMLKTDGIRCNFYDIIRDEITKIIFCMEVFGYDFILDENQRPWLIEVNTNPCLEESSGLLRKLIPRMIDDSLKLTVDVIFPPKKQKQSQKVQIEVKEESLLEETDISIQLGSQPGIGSAGPTHIHSNDQVPTIKVESPKPRAFSQTQKVFNNGQSQSNNSHQNTNQPHQLSSNQQSSQSKTNFPVEGYSDFDNMWNFIYQLKQ